MKILVADDSYWHPVESYVQRFSAAQFSHGVCPECYEEHLRPRVAPEGDRGDDVA